MSLLPFDGPPDAAGPDRIRFGIDWFAFTVKSPAYTPIVKTLVQALGEGWGSWQSFKRGEGWERFKGPHGSLMEANQRDDWVHVQIKGQGCRVVGVERVVALHLLLFTKFGDAYRPKRVDLAWDDFEKRVTPKQVRERFWDIEQGRKRPEVLCKAQGGHAREDDVEARGGSYQIGERCSDRMLRVYDKAAESDGEVNAIRWELVCKKRVAVAAMRAMASCTDNRAAAAQRYLVGFVDFRESAEPSSPRPAWWTEFVGDATRAEVGLPVRSGFEAWRVHYTHQNSSGFRLLTHANGGDVQAAAEELLRANPKNNPRHAVWHAELKRTRQMRRRGEGPDPGPGGAAA